MQKSHQEYRNVLGKSLDNKIKLVMTLYTRDDTIHSFVFENVRERKDCDIKVIR